MGRPDQAPGSPGLLDALGFALSAPAWSGGMRLAGLTRPGPSPGAAGGDGATWDPHGSPGGAVGEGPWDAPPGLGSALRCLALLSRIPLGPWKNTCLQRSVVTCRCLRAAGRHAVVRIGVRRGEEGGTGDVEAHAWVEEGPSAPQNEAGTGTVSGYRPLQPPAGSP